MCKCKARCKKKQPLHKYVKSIISGHESHEENEPENVTCRSIRGRENGAGGGRWGQSPASELASAASKERGAWVLFLDPHAS